MKKKDCFYLGTIIRKHSFKGELIIKLDTDEPEIYENLDAVFLDLAGNMIPFFIKQSSFQKAGQLRVKFEDINTEEDADSLLKTDVYLPLTSLPKLNGNKFYYHEVIGFEVLDMNLGKVGTITNVNDSAAQAFFEIENDGRQILIPVIDEFIEKIDRSHKTIHVKTPEGLIDMYLA